MGEALTRSGDALIHVFEPSLPGFRSGRGAFKATHSPTLHCSRVLALFLRRRRSVLVLAGSDIDDHLPELVRVRGRSAGSE
jgi:hypothetical protein